MMVGKENIKTKLSIFILIIFSLILGSCKDYLDYKSVKIPNDWKFEVIDDWIHIIDIKSEEIIGLQRFKGIYYMVGQTIYDEREYNPYFDDFEYITGGIRSGNSNVEIIAM